MEAPRLQTGGNVRKPDEPVQELVVTQAGRGRKAIGKFQLGLSEKEILTRGNFVIGLQRIAPAALVSVIDGGRKAALVFAAAHQTQRLASHSGFPAQAGTAAKTLVVAGFVVGNERIGKFIGNSVEGGGVFQPVRKPVMLRYTQRKVPVVNACLLLHIPRYNPGRQTGCPRIFGVLLEGQPARRLVLQMGVEAVKRNGPLLVYEILSPQVNRIAAHGAVLPVAGCCLMGVGEVKI